MNVIRPSSEFAIRKTSVAEIESLIKAGHMEDKEPFELIHGVLIAMPGEGSLHAYIKSLLMERLFDQMDRKTHRLIVDSPLFLDDFNAPEPDLYICKRGPLPDELSMDQVPLVIEIADSSFSRDLKLKAPLYAQHDIQEYWIVNIDARVTHCLSQPKAGEYSEVTVVPENECVTSKILPELGFILSELE